MMQVKRRPRRMGSGEALYGTRNTGLGDGGVD